MALTVGPDDEADSWRFFGTSFQCTSTRNAHLVYAVFHDNPNQSNTKISGRYPRGRLGGEQSGNHP